SGSHPVVLSDGLSARGRVNVGAHSVTVGDGRDTPRPPRCHAGATGRARLGSTAYRGGRACRQDVPRHLGGGGAGRGGAGRGGAGSGLVESGCVVGRGTLGRGRDGAGVR